MDTIYELEIPRISKVIQEGSHYRILIQVPEGMLDYPLKQIIKEINDFSKELEIFVSGDPSYGVCDVATNLAKILDCTLLIHFGHTSFRFEKKIQISLKNLGIQLLLIPAFVNINISPFLPKLLDKLVELNWKQVILVSTAQHLNILASVESFLVSNGIEVRNQIERQILGCHVLNARRNKQESVDGVISLHAGTFHTNGMILILDTPIIQLDPYNGDIQYYSSEIRRQTIQKRYIEIHKSKNAKTWGIISSSKLGQFSKSKIKNIKEIMAGNNLDSITVATEKIDFSALSNITWVDAWVNTACPRLAFDDQFRVEKPIISYKEFLYLYNQLSWERLLEMGFF